MTATWATVVRADPSRRLEPADLDQFNAVSSGGLDLELQVVIRERPPRLRHTPEVMEDESPQRVRPLCPQVHREGLSERIQGDRGVHHDAIRPLQDDQAAVSAELSGDLSDEFFQQVFNR